jgi:hypothetical protein
MVITVGRNLLDMIAHYARIFRLADVQESKRTVGVNDGTYTDPISSKPLGHMCVRIRR